MKLNDALYERLTFGVKDDDDFSWSQDRSITLEVLSNEDRMVVAYRFSEKWVSCNSIESAVDEFLKEPVVSGYINASDVSQEICASMIQSVIDLEVEPLEDEFDRSFALIEGEDKVTQDYDGCFFIEESYLSLDATFEEQEKVYLGDSDFSMSLDEIFEMHQDSLTENTTILVME